MLISRLKYLPAPQYVRVTQYGIRLLLRTPLIVGTVEYEVYLYDVVIKYCVIFGNNSFGSEFHDSRHDYKADVQDEIFIIF